MNYLRDLWDCNKRGYLLVIGVLEGQEKEGRLKKYSEMTESFLYLARDINLQVQETEQTTNRINPKKSRSDI